MAWHLDPAVWQKQSKSIRRLLDLTGSKADAGFGGFGRDKEQGCFQGIVTLAVEIGRDDDYISNQVLREGRPEKEQPMVREGGRAQKDLR